MTEKTKGVDGRRRKPGGAGPYSWARRVSQGGFLLLFLFLFIQTEAKGADKLGWPVRLFLDFDPLILLSTLLSSHAVSQAFWLSLIVVVITIILGRVFCGWVCPLGTLNNMVSALGGKNKKAGTAPGRMRLHTLKYLILIALLASATFTMQLVGIMDPLSLLIRSLSLSIYPVFNFLARSFFDAVYGTFPGVAETVTEPVYGLLKEDVLAFRQPYFRQAVLIGGLFLLVMGLNLVERRYWCRYLCPLGALLGLLSRYAILRRSVSEGCTECGACAAVCPGGAEPEKPGGWRPSECYFCTNCDDVCPQGAVGFGFGRKAVGGGASVGGLDLGKRRLAGAAVAGVFLVPLLRTAEGRKPGLYTASLIRPPGARPEGEFLSRCVKCGECMKVCITGGLQPTLLEAGLEGIWSPVLVPRMGYCEFRCTLCGQVCPTGAIEELSLEKKMKVSIGLAFIDRGRCLPYARGRPCIVCEEVCPTPKKAIWFEEIERETRKGETVRLKAPRVDPELCIGCGICEAYCPVADRPAIYVTSIGESRNPDNRLILPGGGISAPASPYGGGGY